MATTASPILLAFWFVGLVVSGIGYAYTYGRLRKYLKENHNPLYVELGLDTITELLGPQSGTASAQEFIFKRKYLLHSDQIVVNLAASVYRVGIAFGISFLCMIAAIVSNEI